MQLEKLQNAVASGRATPFGGALVSEKKELPTDKELSNQSIGAGARYLTLPSKTTTTTEVPWRHAQTDHYALASRSQQPQWEQGSRRRRTASSKVDWNTIPRMEWRKHIQAIKFNRSNPMAAGGALTSPIKPVRRPVRRPGVLMSAARMANRPLSAMDTVQKRKLIAAALDKDCRSSLARSH